MRRTPRRVIVEIVPPGSQPIDFRAAERKWSMRILSLRFTVRLAMIVASIAVCTALVWLAPALWRAANAWVILRDVSRGQSTKYTAQGLAIGGPGVVRALRTNLKSDQAAYRLDAARSLGVIGPEAKAAVPDLIDALHDQDRDVTTAVIFTLGEIGPEAATAVEPLRGMIDYGSKPGVTCMAIEALGRIGPGARRAFPELAAMVRKPHEGAWLFAAKALCQMGPEGRAEAAVALSAVIQVLATDKWAPNRRYAAEVLAEMGSAARQAVSQLETASEDGDAQVRHAAREALKVIKGAP
jgi:HEAT repeat protein